jgi:hypothetical protein
LGAMTTGTPKPHSSTTLFTTQVSVMPAAILLTVLMVAGATILEVLIPLVEATVYFLVSEALTGFGS